MTVVAAESSAPLAPTRRRRWLLVAATIALVVLVAGGDRLLRAYQNRSPYPPASVHARLVLTSIETGKAQDLLDQLAGGHHMTPTWSGEEGAAQVPQIVGQLTLDAPPNAPTGGHYAFFLVDSREGGRPTPHLYGWAGVAAIGSGWDSSYGQIARRYRNLPGMAMVQDNLGGFGAPGMAIGFGARTKGPITLAALSAPTGLKPGDLSPYTGVLAFFGANQHLYWATRIPLTQSR
ncbi:MAG: hypothetical protein QOI76_1360 [Frankiales bacterium]|nr:hypothetical protein [Frankiales bacterium]